MPSASDEVRAAITKMFPDVDELVVAASQFLVDAGFSIHDNVFRSPPGHIVSDDESTCLDYLWQEWDYGYEGEK